MFVPITIEAAEAPVSMDDMEKAELIEDFFAEDVFGFCVRFSYSSHWTDVEVYEYIGQDVNRDGSSGSKFFNRKDYACSPDPVYSIDEAEPYLTGHIKWDGCSEFDIRSRHWCGPRDYLKHFAILEAIYRRSQQLMSSGNNDPWPDSPERRGSRTT